MVWEFVGTKLGLTYSDDFRGAIYVPNEFKNQVSNPKDVAVAVGYNNFLGKTCYIHVVVQKPEFLTRAMICEAFEFPFRDCKLDYLLGPVDAVNEDAVRFNTELGFKEIVRLPNGACSGEDFIIYSMARKDCRWIRGEK
jgi:hypothetical protein